MSVHRTPGRTARPPEGLAGLRASRRDEGFAMPSPVALMSAAAVALAGIAFFVSDGERQAPETMTLSSTPSPTEPPVTIVADRTEPRVLRSKVYIEVYNNSNVTGLAGRTAERISGAGWQVVGSDNWYGTIPATTIYFPPRLQQAAEMLARDLGIQRVLPAVESMNMDRLTVVLTADFA